MIYHIATEEDWRSAQLKEEYLCHDFSKEGFIHASDRSQLTGVVNRYYKSRVGFLVLKIDESKLTVPVKYEVSTNNELYPHIYGPIHRSAILKVTPLELFMNPDEKGNHQ